MKRMDFITTKLVKEKGTLYDIDSKVVKSTEVCAKLLKGVFDLLWSPTEKFCMFTLDKHNKIIGAHIVHIGALNASIVHPREVYQRAILNNAAGIIVCHNHPSGSCQPSSEDIEVTKKLVSVGNILGIKLIDHIIIGGTNGEYLSLKEKGYL